MNITLTGNLGAGKSSICKILEEKGFKIISTGTIFRQIAEERGVSVIELNDMAKTDKSIDKLIDERTAKLGKEMDNAVFDSRLAWNFIPDSFKVFLLVDINEAARRVYQGTARQSEDYGSMEEAAKGLDTRAKLERDRFKDIYGIDYYNASNYNLVIESTYAAPEQLAEEILRCLEEYKESPFENRVELNLKGIYPDGVCGNIANESFDSLVNDEKSDETLCAKNTVSVSFKDGYNYAGEGYISNIAAVKAGKVFTKVTFECADDVLKDIQPAKRADLEKFEKLGGFEYEKYPDENIVNSHYVFEFV